MCQIHKIVASSSVGEKRGKICDLKERDKKINENTNIPRMKSE